MKTISISEPCDEKWDNMTSAGLGKFCSQCHKHVVDFTKHPDQPPVYGMCGRIYGQGHQNISYRQWKWLAFGTLLSALFFHKKAGAQSLPVADSVRGPIVHIEPGDLRGSGPLLVRGRVRDETGEAMPFANIGAFSGDRLMAGCMTGIDGDYTLLIPADSLKEKIFELRVMCLGYETLSVREIPVSRKAYVMDLKMAGSVMLLGGISIEEVPGEQDEWPFDGQTGRFISAQNHRNIPR